MIQSEEKNQQKSEAINGIQIDHRLVEYLRRKDDIYLQPGDIRHSKADAFFDLISLSFCRYSVLAVDKDELKGGQFIMGISHLATAWNWNRIVVRRFISKLAKLGYLTRKTYGKVYIFTLLLDGLRPSSQVEHPPFYETK